MMELLNCPFCGGEAVLSNYVVEASVRCTKCKVGVIRPHAARKDTGIKAAVEAWNRRADVNLQMLEALKNLLMATTLHVFGDECLAERNAAIAAIKAAEGKK
jgi:Ser/Thr protein kinase RdoA (MazF antagonist)